MTKKRWVLFIAVALAILVANLIIRGSFFQKETTLIEVSNTSPYFEEDKPFLAESIVSGSASYRYIKDSDRAEILESDAKELIELLSTTKVKRTSKRVTEDKDSRLYIISLDNNGYSMSYDLSIFLLMKKNKKNEILIQSDFSDVNYVMENSNFYNKVVELIEKNSKGDDFGE